MGRGGSQGCAPALDAATAHALCALSSLMEIVIEIEPSSALSIVAHLKEPEAPPWNSWVLHQSRLVLGEASILSVVASLQYSVHGPRTASAALGLLIRVIESGKAAHFRSTETKLLIRHSLIEFTITDT